MKGGPERSGDAATELFDGREWRTGTSIDHYTPLYRMLRMRGITQHEADLMDITNVALELGVSAHGPDGRAVDDLGPIVGPDGEPVPGTAPVGIKPPSWWRGNRAAFRSSTQAGTQLAGEQGGMNGGSG